MIADSTYKLFKTTNVNITAVVRFKGILNIIYSLELITACDIKSTQNYKFVLLSLLKGKCIYDVQALL